MKTFAFYLLLSFCAFLAQADINGVRLEIKIPASPMLSTELVPLAVTVFNGGDCSIPIMTNDFGYVVGKQLFFEHEQKRPVMLGIQYPFMRRYNKIANFPASTSMVLLPPGQSFTWATSPYGDVALYNAWRAEEATNITAYLRIKEEEWIQSPTYYFQILPHEGEYKTEGLPAYTNVIYSNFTSTRPEVCRVKLNGKYYLFTKNGIRLGELKDNEIPEIKRVSQEGDFSVLFQKRRQRIRYNRQKMMVEPEVLLNTEYYSLGRFTQSSQRARRLLGRAWNKRHFNLLQQDFCGIIGMFNRRFVAESCRAVSLLTIRQVGGTV